jgi:hypothetical protein
VVTGSIHEVKLTRGLGLIMKNDDEPLAEQPKPETPVTNVWTELLFPFQRKVASGRPWGEVSVPMAGGIMLQVKLLPAWAGTLKAELCPSQASAGLGPVMVTSGEGLVLMI